MGRPLGEVAPGCVHGARSDEPKLLVLALELQEELTHEAEARFGDTTDRWGTNRELGLRPPLEAEADVSSERVEVIVSLDCRSIRIEVTRSREDAVVTVACHRSHAVDAHGAHVRFVEITKKSYERGFVLIVLLECSRDSFDCLFGNLEFDAELKHDRSREVGTSNVRFGTLSTKLFRAVEVVEEDRKIEHFSFCGYFGFGLHDGPPPHLAGGEHAPQVAIRIMSPVAVTLGRVEAVTCEMSEDLADFATQYEHSLTPFVVGDRK